MQDEERIRERAYRIWESEGRPEGRQDAHWEQARRECEAEEVARAGETSPPGEECTRGRTSDATTNTGKPKRAGRATR
jgi:hypothetical protein